MSWIIKWTRGEIKNKKQEKWTGKKRREEEDERWRIWFSRLRERDIWNSVLITLTDTKTRRIGLRVLSGLVHTCSNPNQIHWQGYLNMPFLLNWGNFIQTCFWLMFLAFSSCQWRYNEKSSSSTFGFKVPIEPKRRDKTSERKTFA